MFKYLPILLLLSFHLFLLANLQFTAWPEMFSFPYLRNNDYLLYKDMVHPYPPVLTMVLAYVYKIFGYSEFVLKTFTWSLILFSSSLVWYLAKKITKNNVAALISLGVYVVTQPLLEGNMMWPDMAIVPPLLLGAIFLLDKKYFWAGLFLALSGFIKQTGGLFYVGVLGFLLLSLRRPLFVPGNVSERGRLFEFLIGPVLFSIPLLVRLLQEGALRGFLNWVIIYPSIYWSKFPGYVQMSLSKSEILIVALLLTPLLFAKQIFKSREWQILTLFMVLSLISVYPRFSFFHLQSLIAFSTIAFGLSWSATKTKGRAMLVVSIFLLVWRILPGLKYEWQKETRFISEGDKNITEYIKENTQNSEIIYLHRFNSNQYVLTNTLPPKPWLDNFGWYWEVPGVEEEILSKWEKNPPEKIFWEPGAIGNWYDLGVYQSDMLVKFLQEHYMLAKEELNGVQIWKRN